LDIITNKVPENEREGVPHHLMEFLEPEDEYLVTQFVKDAAIKVYFDNAGVMCLNCVLTQGKD
jgi:tRNA A37 N6-isopentenylltransferase MiaA